MTRPRPRDLRKQKIKDWLVTGASILGLILLVVVIVGAVAARIWAPCEWIDWLPVKDVPTRCLSVDVR